MADIFDPSKRSEIMSRIRSTGTKPERRLYALVRGVLGHRWRIDRNVATLPGQPDVVLPTLSIAIFADGCFFHQCPKHGRIPDSNSHYWAPKLKRNVARDRTNRKKLRSLGYAVWRFWGHDFTGPNLPATQRALERRLARRVEALRQTNGRCSRSHS